jgi:hypothetical protein
VTGQIVDMKSVQDLRVFLPAQNYYVKEWAGNFMMHLMVKDADLWWQHIQEKKIPEK